MATMNTVSFLTDDEPEGPECPRLHILAADDYYLSISESERPGGATVRAATDGARDSRVTLLIAALYKLGRNDIPGAIRCAESFVRLCQVRQ